MDEGRHITAKRDQDMDRPIHPIRLVNLLQALAKGMGGHPDDGVGLRIEIVAPPQRFRRDRIFLNLLVLTLKVLLADICEHSGEITGSAECPGGEQPVQLIFFRLKPAGDYWHSMSPIRPEFSFSPPGYQGLYYARPDRKSTRLNSSHLGISYA